MRAKGTNHRCENTELRSSREIERKFLIPTAPPNLRTYPHHRIRQGYVGIPDEMNEIRLRQKGDCFYLTVKSGSGLSRTEREITLSRGQFKTLWFCTQRKRIEKTRYEVCHRGHTIELDVYEGDHSGLVTAEVEFGSLRDSRKFKRPDWLGPEITHDERYKKRSLALDGIPE